MISNYVILYIRSDVALVSSKILNNGYIDASIDCDDEGKLYSL